VIDRLLAAGSDLLISMDLYFSDSAVLSTIFISADFAAAAAEIS
jgi:hypothetical protein